MTEERNAQHKENDTSLPWLYVKLDLGLSLLVGYFVWGPRAPQALVI